MGRALALRIVPTAVGLMALVSLLSSCTPDSIRPTSGPQAARDRIANSDIELRVLQLIVPDGQGAWTRGAKWNEWVLSVKNVGNRSLALNGVYLEDSRGILIRDTFKSTEELESFSQPGAGADRSDHRGLLGMLIDMVAGMGPSHLSPTSIPIEDEVQARRLPQPRPLPPQLRVTGSVFFPLIPDTTALVLEYGDLLEHKEWLRLPFSSPLAPDASP